MASRRSVSARTPGRAVRIGLTEVVIIALLIAGLLGIGMLAL
jgi:hypothetical protein